MAGVQLESFCQLISSDKSYPAIDLPDGEPVRIGRGPLTHITDKKISRNQVELTSDYDKQEVTLKQLGSKPSKVGDQLLSEGDTYTLGPGGCFQLVADCYKYHVHFGKKVSESVLKDLQKESKKTDDRQGSLQESDEVHVSTSECNSSSGKGHKRKRSEDIDKLCSSDPKQVKLESPCVVADALKAQTSAHPAKSQQKSLDRFFKTKPKSGMSNSPSASQFDTKWKEDIDTLLVFQYGPPTHSAKIAAFDVDGTLIETASGKRFATGPNDWKLIKNVSEKLRSLHDEGFKVVLLSNQLGIIRGKPTKEEFKQKMEGVARKLCVPLLLLAATSRDSYRKPCTGMWEHVVQHENGGVKVEKEVSFFVGDAAGREAGWMPGSKKDFSCADRKFAANLNLKFMTPQECFLGYPNCTKFTWGDFDPRSLDYTQATPKLEPPDAKIFSEKQEVIIFVGCPASGKSTFYKSHLKSRGYIHVNRDILGTWQKCVAECEKVLKVGKSVAVDNTNPDAESRLRYIECARKNSVLIRCFVFTTSVAQAKHNNKFRELTVNDSSYKKVNDLAFNMYKSKFTEPEMTEGFSQIVKITINPSFDSDKLATLYRQFLD